MHRYRLTIEYDGTPYHGWQYQKHCQSVQEAIEESIFQFCQENIRVFGAGRTDTGVHAQAQIAHIDLSKKVNAHRLKSALNYFLREKSITICEAKNVSLAFDARFSATQRHYLYRIVNAPHPSPLRQFRAWCIYNTLNIDAIRQAASIFVGKHDFTTFRSVHCQSSSPIKNMNKVSIIASPKDSEIHMYFSAPSFMRHQIRSMVGSLIQVGLNKWPVEKINTILKACDRSLCAPLAPAYGLYLYAICYDCQDNNCICHNI